MLSFLASSVASGTSLQALSCHALQGDELWISTLSGMFVIQSLRVSAILLKFRG